MSILTARTFQSDNVLVAVRASSDGALVSIPYVTEQTHAGKFFFASFYNAAVANGATLDMIINTGTTLAPHFGVDVNTGGEGIMQIFEAATTSSDGTQLTVFNANRASSKVTTATVFQTPTVTGTGTTLITSVINGGRGNNAVGASSGDFARITEIIMKTSTKYLVRFTNNSGTAQPVSMQFGYFEDV